MLYRLVGSLFAASLLVACAQTDDPEMGSDEAPPAAMAETEVMAEEKASMEAAMSDEKPMAEEAQMASEPADTSMAASMTDSYTVFFAFNSAILTAEAESVIDDAVQAAAAAGSSSIGIVGYTDAVGSRSQNETMSRWRAQAVADELVFRGVSPTALEVSWLGDEGAASEDDPDQSNRRVVIDIR